MNNKELQEIAEVLIKTTFDAGKKSIELYNKGLKKIIKPDNIETTSLGVAYLAGLQSKILKNHLMILKINISKRD